MEIPGDLGDINNHPCTTCCGSSASCWCVDCSEASCDDCSAAHRRVTSTRSHRVLNHQPEGQSLISPTKFCRNHPSEESQSFCFTCCQLTCRDCQSTEHMSHSFDFVSKAVESVVKQSDACMQPIRAQMEASTRSSQDMETRSQFSTQSEATMTSKSQKNVDTSTSLSKKRFEEITTQIQTVFSVERNMISRKVQRSKQLQKNHVPSSEAVEKARSTSNSPTSVACISQITSQSKDSEDEDSRPPSRMVNSQVTTNKGAVQGISNFGQIRVSWVPFSVSRVDSPTGSSSSSSSPALSSSHYSISSRPESSNRTGQHQPGPGSGAAPPVRRPASDSEPSSGSRGPAAQSSQPVSSIVIKSKMAQAIETSNPFLYSLSLQTSSSDPPAPSTGPNPHQNPPSCSAPSTGPVHHQNPSYSAPSTGPIHHQNPSSYSAPAPSTGPIQHQNPPSYSAPAPSTGPVHHQNPSSYSAPAPSTGPIQHQNPSSYSAPSTGPIQHQNPPSHSAPAPSTGPVHHQNPSSYSAPSTGPNNHQNPPSYSAPSTGPNHHQNPSSYSAPAPAPSTGPNHHQNPPHNSAPPPAPSTGPNHHQNSPHNSAPPPAPSMGPIQHQNPPSYSAPSTGPNQHQNPSSYSAPAPSMGPIQHQNPPSYSAPSTGPNHHQNPSSYSAPSMGPIQHQNPSSYSAPAPSMGPIQHQNPPSYSAPSTGPNHHQNPSSYSAPSTGPNNHQNPPHNSAPPPAPSTGPVHYQNPPSCSAPAPTSSSSTTPKGSKWKRVGPSVSGGSESSVRINVSTKSQSVSNSGKMFVKFQWKNRVSRSSSSSGSPQKSGGSVRTSTGIQSYRYSTPSTFSILPQSAGAASQPVHPPSISTQHVAPVQNQSISSSRTDAGSDPPPPETFPGNVASVPQSPAAPEVRFGPESVNQSLPEQSPTENLRVQQSKEPEPDQPDPTRPLKGSSEPTETRPEEIQSRETEIIEVLSDDDGEPPAGPAADPTRTPEDPTVLSEEEGSSDGGSSPDVYEVKPGFGEVQTLSEPFTPGASGNEDAAVENEPPPDESKVTGALPGTSEDSVASSEEPELRSKSSSSETSGSEDEDEPSAESWQQDHTQHNWQPTVSSSQLPSSSPGPGRPSPRYHFISGNQKDESYSQEVEDDSQSSCEDVSETASDHASDVTEDFTEVHSPESPLCSEVISCAACGSSSASKICTLCGRGYHRDCHVPPFGPDIWSELVCSSCQDSTDPSDPYSADRPKSPQSSALSSQDQRKCETLSSHSKVEGCRRLSQLDSWSDSMSISERSSLHLSPPYQTPAQVVSDLWDSFANASQGDALAESQRSFQKKSEETFGSDLPPSSSTAPAADAPRGPEGPSGSPGARGGESKSRDSRKRSRDFSDSKGPSAAKRPKTEKPEDASWSDGKNEGGAGSS